MGRKKIEVDVVIFSITAIFIIGFCCYMASDTLYVLSLLEKYWNNRVIPLILVILFIVVTIFKIKKAYETRIEEKKRLAREQEQQRQAELYEMEMQRKHQEELNKEMNKVRVSDNREDYIISNRDYARGNEKESEYRKRFMLKLLTVFGNECAICGRSDNGFDLDHFIIPKNYGGNFVLIHKNGYLINNAVPLCQTCNRSKSDESYKKIFASEEELYEVLKKNKKMTVMINNDKDFCEYIKSL